LDALVIRRGYTSEKWRIDEICNEASDRLRSLRVAWKRSLGMCATEAAMDAHEDLNVGGIHLWPLEFAFKTVKEYLESLKRYPNPPPVNFTNFSGPRD
jgi:hypothetical protein